MARNLEQSQYRDGVKWGRRTFSIDIAIQKVQSGLILAGKESIGMLF